MKVSMPRMFMISITLSTLAASSSAFAAMPFSVDPCMRACEDDEVGIGSGCAGGFDADSAFGKWQQRPAGDEWIALGRTDILDMQSGNADAHQWSHKAKNAFDAAEPGIDTADDWQIDQ